MLTRLRLKQFKNFQDADLTLGPFTVLVGSNASGKSNLRDALRVLHGIGRGYTLAEIIGEHYGESGVLQWRGIRGGTREIAFHNAATCTLDMSFTIEEHGTEHEGRYRIDIDPGSSGRAVRVVDERWLIKDIAAFRSVSSSPESQSIAMHVLDGRDASMTLPFFNDADDDPWAGHRWSEGTDPYIFSPYQPILSQCLDRDDMPKEIIHLIRLSLGVLKSMRFLDLNPESMRQPSFPGQTTLGDRGENLSSVLQEICADPQRKTSLIQWLQELTPMDAVDVDFPVDQIGRILVTLVEEHGPRITAYSASDGTLRFLGMLAALLSPEPARFFFVEELENGIHPTRLYLLLQLIEQQTARHAIQVTATTHSPQLLRLVSPTTLEHTSLTYRLQGRPDGQIKRLLDLPDVRRLIEQQDLARLHESGWLEDVVEFLAYKEAV